MSVLSRLFPRDPGALRELELFDLRDLSAESRRMNEMRIRALCASTYLGEDRVVGRVLGRYKMFVDARDIGHSTHLLLDGYWEMWVTEAIAAVLRPGMTCIDVGANLGYFTLLMADMSGSGGTVHAFEPNPPIADRLRDTLSINGFGERTRVHQVALGAEEGARVRLVVPNGEPKNAHVVPVIEGEIGRNIILTRRLDSYFELLEADFIKIDADTAEEAIWEGMSGLLSSERRLTIVLEFAAARYDDPAAFLAKIAASGFSMSLIDSQLGMHPVDTDTILRAPDRVDQILMLVR